MRELNGKVALVTGAASGIGFSIAKALANAGAKVAIADRDPARLEQAAAQISSRGGAVHEVVLDVTDYDAWQAAIGHVEQVVGPVSLLVNSAGIGGGSNLVSEEPARWRQVIEVNLMGTFYGCRAALPGMLARGQPAHLVNIASLSGLRANAGMSSYDASKFAVVGLSDTLRLELAGGNVGISVVYPGMTRTSFVENSRAIIAENTGKQVPSTSGVGDALARGMDPDKLADRVLAAICAGEYHVFTHADWKPIIAEVFAERLAAFGENADPAYSEDIAGLKNRIEFTQRIAQQNPELGT